MHDETEAPGVLPGNQGRPGTDGVMENHNPTADHEAGDDTHASNPAPHKPESDETSPGPHQVQGGMRS